jgi:L-ascorbate metabolism protein UlaG (beta-lactamase superfamily)
MQIQLLRHATLRISIGAHTILLDPMLSDKDAMDPIQNSGNDRRNPLVPLPFSPDEILKNVTAVLVTHTHRDHWDPAATELVPRTMPIFCQPEDASKFTAWGYTDVRPIVIGADFNGLQLHRTAGQHGTGEIGRQMAPVSGFVLRCEGEPTLYIAGDTIFCPEIESALATHHPNIAVLNAGAAQFTTGNPITMSAIDVAKVCRSAPDIPVVAVHMEAINHCLLTRDELLREMKNYKLEDRVVIPGDGETLEF